MEGAQAWDGGRGLLFCVLLLSLLSSSTSRFCSGLVLCSQGPALDILRHFVDRIALTSKLRLTSPIAPGHFPNSGVLPPCRLKCQGHVTCRAWSPCSRNPVYRKDQVAGQGPRAPCIQTDGSAGICACLGLLAKTAQAQALPGQHGVPAKWRPAYLCHCASGN